MIFDRGRCNRRDVLKTVAAGCAGLAATHFPLRRLLAADVEWLGDVQRMPETVPRDDVGYLEPLLIDSDGRPIETVEAWQPRRREIRNRWLSFLGPLPDERPEVKLEILQEDRPSGCVRQLVRYESEPGRRVEGYLLRPDGPAKNKARPGLVALHPTSTDSIDEIAGVKGPEAHHLAPRFCRRGFVVFCPRCFLWQDAENYQQAVEDFRQRHPKSVGMWQILYDALRGVDVLASLDDVDPERIGAFGHSLGAKETLYLLAFDERVKAGVASEGGVGFKSTNWDAAWYLGPAINDPSFKLNHHQVLALIAPRPFLILAGESGRGAADGDRTWPYVEAALPVYRLYGEPARLGILNHHQGHSIPPAAFERMAQWLETYVVKG